MSDAPETIVKVALPRRVDKGKFAIVIPKVFSDEECKRMIDETEQKGYESAFVNVGDGRQVLDIDCGKNSRCISDSVEKSNEIWERVKEHAPSTWNFGSTSWQAVGLNERLRFLRYSPGDFFAPHYDGYYQRENGECSFITLLLYLNEGFEGGTTNFLDIDRDGRQSEVKPRAGDVLLFQHDIFHSGTKVSAGLKYVVRTDVMYAKAAS
jgi:predicted 2-oxoglutarate/Fe(II)-dependent dioxygenase YbiX